ncbi:filamentation induced by cAMP protein fic [Berryella intestinalis]|uniref:Filamentation induced by cAMP protein fic n=2 Tax=Berryella intestinalis TaxID=1531429 RepID=A0A0A8B1T7_9ACTN|nr:filamentation induced by cAMP protein fic [Berryella intestinalis]
MRYENNGQGYLRKNLAGEAAEYTSFVPASLASVVPVELSEETVRLLSACSRKLGELEGMLRFVPNASMYLAMYVRKEALLSAQIEGTQCTFDDILDPENTELIKRNVADVVSYIKATEYAVERMQELPLCMRLLKEVHSQLLADTRGAEKSPGQVRSSQNWIGPNGCGLRDAAFIPPNVEDMNEALSDLEKFINDAADVDPVVKASLVHYQFETVHPFLDGNGRLGRLLVTLSLMNDGALSAAVFYPSYQLKLRRKEYYERLMAVREEGEYAQWVGFFCECLLSSAQDAIGSLERLVDLHAKNTSLINESLGRSVANGQRLLELLESNPIVDVSYIANKLDTARTTASNLVSDFVELGILVQRDKEKQRYRTFLYEEYLSILRQGSDPL